MSMLSPDVHPCAYCTLNSSGRVSEQFIRFGETAKSMLYLHRDQSLPGRMVIAVRTHARDVTDLPDDVHADFFDTVRAAARAARNVFPSTRKINLAVGGNLPQFSHPHVHLVPRHTGDRKWPDFTLDVQQPFWPANDRRFAQTIERLLADPNFKGRVRGM